MGRDLKFRAFVDGKFRYFTARSGLYGVDHDVVVGQYIGVKDKNGNDVYEGDIYSGEVKLSPDGVSSASGIFYYIPAVFVIAFKKDGYVGEWKIEGVKNGKYLFNREGFSKIDLFSDFEIIGNIHQTKEKLTAA